MTSDEFVAGVLSAMSEPSALDDIVEAVPPVEGLTPLENRAEVYRAIRRLELTDKAVYSASDDDNPRVLWEAVNPMSDAHERGWTQMIVFDATPDWSTREEICERTGLKRRQVTCSTRNMVAVGLMECDNQYPLRYRSKAVDYESSIMAYDALYMDVIRQLGEGPATCASLVAALDTTTNRVMRVLKSLKARGMAYTDYNRPQRWSLIPFQRYPKDIGDVIVENLSKGPMTLQELMDAPDICGTVGEEALLSYLRRMRRDGTLKSEIMWRLCR